MSSVFSGPRVSIAGPPQAMVASRVRQAFEKAFGSAVAAETDPLIFTAKPEFGDYQCNAAMSLAKKLKMKPQEVAQSIAKALTELEAAEVAPLISTSDISVTGPGFVNMRLSPTLLQDKLFCMHSNEQGRLGINRAPRQKVIVDYSSPNIAKEMHVGHLRSTIIGDSLARLQEFLGHEVVRLNHVGDWGTQFGMLITKLNKEKVAQGDKVRENISDLVEFYKAAKKDFDEDKDFQETSRNEVVKLQGGDADTLSAWQDICDLSRREFSKVYDMLGVTGLEERGESFYNPFLPELVQELEKSGIAVMSEGALCIFLDGYSNIDGTPLPLLIRKSDGGFLYATTDLAAVRHRATVEKADRVLYVTDVGQAQHFQMVFDASRKSGLLPPTVELKHVPFGLVQGEDGKKFKTRAGDTVKLKDLLDEAVRTAGEVLAAEGGPEGAAIDPSKLSEEQQRAARVIGIGAVKYADLSMNRESNYRFSFKKMLALQGNTAPYMLYAYARIQGIRRKALEETAAGPPNSAADILLQAPEERLLGVCLLKFEEVLLDVSRDLYPSKLCEYLFDLSQKFNQFYENCSVLKAETPELVRSRTALCSITADTLKLGLNLLGIDTLEKL